MIRVLLEERYCRPGRGDPLLVTYYGFGTAVVGCSARPWLERYYALPNVRVENLLEWGKKERFDYGILRDIQLMDG